MTPFRIIQLKLQQFKVSSTSKRDICLLIFIFKFLSHYFKKDISMIFLPALIFLFQGEGIRLMLTQHPTRNSSWVLIHALKYKLSTDIICYKINRHLSVCQSSARLFGGFSSYDFKRVIGIIQLLNLSQNYHGFIISCNIRPINAKMFAMPCHVEYIIPRNPYFATMNENGNHEGFYLNLLYKEF